MSKTEVSGKQIKDGSIDLVDLSAAVAGDISQLKSDVSTLQTDVASKASSAGLATVATSGAYSDLSGTPTLAAVATSGSYTDLADKPSIPSITGLASETYVDTAVAGKADSSSLAAVATSGSYVDLINKPSLFDGAYSSLTGAPSLATVATSGSYTDLADKPSIPSISGLATETYVDSAVAGKADSAALATVATSGSYADLTNKPSIPSITGLATETYVDTKVADLVASAPASLDTLKELSDALGADANFATTMTNALAAKASTASLATVATSGSYADLANKPSIPSSIDDLSDVTITTPSADQVLKYNGSAWVNSAAPSSGITSLGSQTGATQTFAVGTSGTDFAISSSSNTHTFNLPDASASARGLITTGTQTIAGQKNLTGQIGVNEASPGSQLQVTSGAAARKGLIVKAAASATANLLEVQNSSATAMFSVDSSGNISIASTTVSSNISIIGDVNSHASLSLRSLGTPASAEFYLGQGNNNIAYVWQRGANKIALGTSNVERMTIAGDGTTGVNEASPGGQLQVTSGAAARKAMIVKAAASQSANIFEVQNSSASTLFSINSVGSNMTLSPATGSVASFDISANFLPLRLGIAYNQYGSYTGPFIGAPSDFQSISFRMGGSLTYEAMRIEGFQQNSLIPRIGIGTNTFTAQLAVTTASASRQALIIKGAASQTANLFEAQNSAGTSVVSFTNAGAASFSSNITTTGAINFGPTGILTLTSNGNYNGVALGRSSSTGESGLALGSYTTAGTNCMHIAWGGGGTGRWFQGLSSGEVGIGVSTPGAQLHLQSKTASMKGLIVQAAASQTANMLEFQNSSGTALTVVQSDGTLHAKRYTNTAVNAFNTALAPSSGTLTIDTSLGDVVVGAPDAAVTTWAFTNVPTENSKATRVLVVMDGTDTYTYGDACSVNGSAVTDGVMWSGGSAPTATNNYDMIEFTIVKDSAGTIKVFGVATTNFS